MWTYLILLLIIVILFLLLSMVWPPDSPWAPWWRTKDPVIRGSLKLAKITKKDIVYDLGSGDGRVLIIATKEFGARGVGVEIDPLRYLVSKFFVKTNNVSDRVKIIRGNFLAQDLSSATTVFLYLVPKALGRLKSKLISELKPGTKIITIKYDFPEKTGLSKTAENKKMGIRVYKII